MVLIFRVLEQSFSDSNMHSIITQGLVKAQLWIQHVWVRPETLRFYPFQLLTAVLNYKSHFESRHNEQREEIRRHTQGIIEQNEGL